MKQNLKIFLFLTFILFSFSIKAFSSENAGKIIFFSGKVLYSTDNGETWKNVFLKQMLKEGTCIRTDAKSEAALLLNDHSQIRIKSNSIFCLKRSGSAPGVLPIRTGLNKLLKGKIWFRNKRKGSKPIFETPVVTASIRGTEMVIAFNKNSEKSDVTVLEGKVKCFNNKGSVVINRGEVAETVQGKAPKITLLAKPELSAQWLIITPNIVGPKERNLKTNYLTLAKDSVKELAFGNLKKAKNLINKAYKLNPNSASVNVAMATVLQSEGKFQKALIYANKAYSIDSLSIPALLRKAELLLGLNKISDAFKLINSFKGKDDARIHIVKGYLFLIKKELKEAMSEFNTAISMNPSVGTSHLGLGIAFFSLGQFKKGIAEMEKASLLDPFAAYPHNYLGKALYEIGERHEAEIELKRAMQLDPNDPTPHLYLSIILADEYRDGEGIEEIQKAIKLNDNLLATRSRFLLDEDRAIKNVSLAYSLSEMGLNEWAKATGDLAVWNDPSNSGAYLFRATEAVAGKEIDPATLGDVKRAQLLQPVNSNTYITYTSYQSLLEIPQIKGSLWGMVGNDETVNTGGFIEGGSKKVAFYTDAIYHYTDGPRGNSDEQVKQGFIKLKGDLSENHQLFFSSTLGHRDEGDLNAWVFHKIPTEDIDKNMDYWSVDLGYHWRQGAGKNLLVNIQAIGTDSNSELENPLHYSYLKEINSKYHSNTWRFEFLELYRVSEHRISFGGSLENNLEHPRTTYYYPIFWNITPDKFSIRATKKERRIYFRDIWKHSKAIITGGLSYCFLDNIWTSSKGYKEKEKILPEIGFVYNLTKKDIIRTAYFQEIQPHYLSGSLQPVEIAGFKKVVGVYPGTWTRFYGIGWDRNWSEKIFTRIELSRVTRRYPYVFTPYPFDKTGLASWRNEKFNNARFVLNTLLSKNFALALSLNYKNFKVKNPSRKRDDYSANIMLAYTNPDGIKAQFVLWFVSQNEKDNDFGEKFGDDFIIPTFYIEKSLFNKKGLISLTLENITNEKYNYLISETTQSTQLPWEGFLGTLKFQWNF